MLNPNEIFADLINFRENIGAPLKHTDYNARFAKHYLPKPILLYIPNYYPNEELPKFHFMHCFSVREAVARGTILSRWVRTSRTDGQFRMFDGSLKSLQVCRNCRNEWRKPLPKPFNIKSFFAQFGWHPEIWNNMTNLPTNIDTGMYRTGCFLLYRPVKFAPFFHFMRCRKVSQDEKIGWIKTYRFTSNLSGFFAMFDERNENGEYVRVEAQKLRVCPDCLAEWDGGNGWENYSRVKNNQKENIKRKFSILKFFDFCNSLPARPRELDELYELIENGTVWVGTTADNNYPGNWSSITKMFRTVQGYRCEQCGVDLSRNRRLLVTHHLNGSHSDISPNNMKVLCVCCHAKQPYHKGLEKVDPQDRALIEELRRQQGITD